MVWTLVYEPKTGGWLVEKAEPPGALVVTELGQFDRTAEGERLGAELAVALQKAQDDF
jgi:hypothetical protein